MRPTPHLLLFILWCLTGPVAAAALTVQVDGVKGEHLKNVLAFLEIAREKDRPGLTEGRIRRLHAQAPGQIRQALEPFGYYRVQVQDQLTREPEGWLARYHVDPGPAVLITKVDLELTGQGRSDEALVKVLQRLPLRQGQALEHARYEQAKRTLQEAAASRGYLDARFAEHSVRVSLDPYQAVVELHFATGRRYQFGEVRFLQQAYSEQFLARYLPFHPGDPYSARSLLALQKVLSDSDRFNTVEVTPLVDEARDDRVPVQVRLVAKKRDLYKAGLGYGTDTGPRVSLGWERRRVNRSGHRGGVDIKVSSELSSIEGHYLIPLQRPASDQLKFTGGVARENTKTRLSQTVTLGASRSTRRGQWRENLSLTYQQEHFEVAGQNQTDQLLMPGVSWSVSRADDPVYPRRGLGLSLDLRAALDKVFSDTSFLRARADGKVVRGLGSDYRVLARAAAGAALVGRVEDLPGSQRFYAGGDQSVRGYALDALGPKDDQGLVTGGRYLLVGSLELERRLFGNWSAAVFYDAGNAFNSLNTQIKRGAGVGVRWRSPVGLIRVDVASALSEPGHPLRLHVVIGPDL